MQNLSDAWSHLIKRYVLTRWCLDSKMNRLYTSFSSSNQLFSHWSDWLSLLQIRSLIIRQLSDISSHSDSFLRRQFSSFRYVWLHWDQIIRDIRIILNDELRFWFIEINIFSNLVLFDQFLKLFYLQMIILWDQHDHEEIKNFFVHSDVTKWSQVFWIWDFVLHLTKSFYASWWIAIRIFLMKTCCDRFSLIYWLMLLLLLKRKFCWLLASDISSS